jgi:hypothetical protein
MTVADMRQTRGSIGIALLAALVLALQSALAVAAAPVQRDIFGNAICADGSGGQMPGGHEEGHLPDCCVLSCGSAFQTAADIPASNDWPGPTLVGKTIVPVEPLAISSRERRTPANPRAPPAAA